MPSQFARFLDESMELLARERPTAFDTLARTLHGRRVRLTVDGDPVVPRFSEAGFSLCAEEPEPDVELESDRATILDVAEGRLTIEDAVWDERIVLRGALDELVRFHDALLVYLQGAVRCPSFPKLLDSYRSEAS